jgi:glycosyltransferase involved in cell wall biosynthesis
MVGRLSLVGKRVALVTNIPRPYRVPLFEALDRRITSEGGALKVFFYSDSRKHARRQGIGEPAGSYASKTVAGLDISVGFERVISIPWKLWPRLGAYHPDVVVSGAFGLPGYMAWLYSRAAIIPYVQWSGATPDRQGQGGPLARHTQGFLARRAEASVSYGTAARNYLVGLGVPPACVVTGVNAVDVTLFKRRAEAARAEAASLKTNRHLTGINLLYVGSLVPRKGHSNLLEALARLTGANGQFHLHLIGTGPLENELRAQVGILELVPWVHFWGAMPPERVALFYALADVFVFPSLYDPWGLVLNEAMACGLPVIASPLAGATCDLVEDGVNGFAVDPRDVPALTRAIARLMIDTDLRTRMGAAALATVRDRASIEHSASAFLEAIAIALSRSSSRDVSAA